MNLRSFGVLFYFRKEQEEREERKKRLSAIMSRTRTSDSAATPARSTSPVMPNLSASTREAGLLQATPTNGHAPSDSAPTAVLSSSSASVLQKLASSSPALGNLLSRHRSKPQLADLAPATNQMEQNGVQMTSSVVVHSEGGTARLHPSG